MRGTTRIGSALALATALVLPVLTSVGATLAAASPGNGPTAIVSLGDSFISGEAGRWNGNSDSAWRSRRGTDRAYRSRWWGGWYYDRNAVYPGTVGNGCHRSNVAPIQSNTIPVANKINLACSGAATANIVDQNYKGEAPQAAQLLSVAQSNDVEMVVLSIGGNDLGFSDIIVACTLQFSTSPSAFPNLCQNDQQPLVDAAMPAAMAGVSSSIDAIRASMAAAGYTSSDYRFVLVSYPSPIPRGSEIRYSESSWSRLTDGGCPFWDADATWARDSLVPQISDNLQAVAAAQGVEFLDHRDAFQGNENCSNQAVRAPRRGGPNGATAEWTRWIGSGLLQGDLEESAHPNAYGQQALGTCLSLLWAQTPGNFACTNVAGQGPSQMTLQPA